ncbi:MAG: membrane protein insertion efficiency factor YidD [Alphaproteobacteria bacterium]|nr:membrane protein insertion efficiency factor YidD [Alphaproteobacteria bacterium]
MRLAVQALRALVFGYRYTLSPLVGAHCRFLPTCSEYALEALERHGAARGAWLTGRRLVRCHPWGGAGWDPVPDARRPAPDDGSADAVTRQP